MEENKNNKNGIIAGCLILAIFVLTIALIFINNASSPKNFTTEYFQGEDFFIMKDGKNYTGEYYTEYKTIEEDDYDYMEHLKVYDVKRYYEYERYCELMDIDQKYTDENKNYIVFGHFYTPLDDDEDAVRLVDVIAQGNVAKVYAWENNEYIANNTVYITVIPVDKKITRLELNSCYTQEEFEKIRDFDINEIEEKKPIIYLYPEEETDVTVSLELPENITHSYPLYEDFWKVKAFPDGNLLDLKSGKQLYVLYYEAKSNTNFKVEDEGFVVKGEDVANFLEEKLEILGLNAKEKEEFIIYWLPVLENNEYNYIRFATKEEIDSAMPLNINPTPDTTIRVLITFKGLDNPINVKEQTLKKVTRSGFTVVEWGGAEIR